MPQIELVPILAIFLFDVEVLVVDDVRRGLDLDVTTSAEVDILTFGQLEHEILDEGGHILV